MSSIFGEISQQMSGWTVERIAIAIIIVAALVAIVYVGLRVFKVQVPEWLIHIVWICIVAVVCIVAIKFVSQLW